MSDDREDAALRARLQELRAGRSVPACAAAWGLKVSTARQNLVKSVPNAISAAKIADAEKVNLRWLILGKGPKYFAEGFSDAEQSAQQICANTLDDGEFSLVPRYDVRLSSGRGAMVSAEDIIEYLAFRTSWLKSMDISPQFAALATNEGHSNAPMIPDGALLLLDVSKREPRDGKFFAIRRDGELLLKQIQRKIDGGIVLKPYNTKDGFEPEELPPDRVDDLAVIGRLMWFGRSI